MTYLAYFYWDPNPDVFVIPFFEHPVRWYGLCFVIGFIVAYKLVARVLLRKLRKHPSFSSDQILDEGAVRSAIKEGPVSYVETSDDLLGSLNKAVESGDPFQRRTTLEAQLGGGVRTLAEVAEKLTDRIAWFVVLGTIIGARLGHCLFYDWERYSAHPLEILRVWEGGLASHGGAIGIVTALYLFRLSVRKNYPWLNFFALGDSITLCTGFVGFCIRIGNFINQEILGTPSQLPWAVMFGHPWDGSLPVPRHPVQLYEALVYLAIFALLWRWWRRSEWADGFVSGLFLVLTFVSRFILEFWKMPQTDSVGWLHMGQWLSIPFVMLGLVLLWSQRRAAL